MTESDRLQYATISPEEWESFPDSKVKPSSRWEEALDALEHGQIIQMKYIDRRDKLSKRISIARQAAARGFKTDMRYTDDTMAVRRIEGSPVSSQQRSQQDGAPIPRRGRRRRNQQEIATLTNEGIQSDLGIEDLQEALD